MMKVLAAAIPLILCLPAIAAPADPPTKCRNDNLRGRYVFTASGFQRAPGSLPGSPWVPKAIVEVLQFSGDGLVTTPHVTIANPPSADAGIIVSPPGGGANGEYFVNDDCTGTLHFFDAGNVTFNIVVDRTPRADTIWMIQTNPANNVFQGTAKRTDN